MPPLLLPRAKRQPGNPRTPERRGEGRRKFTGEKLATEGDKRRRGGTASLSPPSHVIAFQLWRHRSMLHVASRLPLWGFFFPHLRRSWFFYRVRVRGKGRGRTLTRLNRTRIFLWAGIESVLGWSTGLQPNPSHSRTNRTKQGRNISNRAGNWKRIRSVPVVFIQVFESCSLLRRTRARLP